MENNSENRISPRCSEIMNYLKGKELTPREIETGMNPVYFPIDDGEISKKIEKELTNRIENEVIPCLLDLLKRGVVEELTSFREKGHKYRISDRFL